MRAARPAVYQDAVARRRFDEYCIALTDVEHGDPESIRA